MVESINSQLERTQRNGVEDGDGARQKTRGKRERERRQGDDKERQWALDTGHWARSQEPGASHGPWAVGNENHLRAGARASNDLDEQGPTRDGPNDAKEGGLRYWAMTPRHWTKTGKLVCTWRRNRGVGNGIAHARCYLNL